MVTMSKSKLEHLKKVSNANGIIAAAAMDQRGSLQKSIAKAKGAAVTDAMMEEFKIAVTKALSPHATAMLLDPEWGLPAAKTARDKNCGLLLAYEKSGYDNTTPGRLPDLLDDWSVEKLKAAGADCCKILLYYTPFDTPEINAIKHEWTAKIGDECEKAGLPYFLEFVGYAADGADEKTVEFAKLKPQIVRRSMEEFSKPHYKVDVLKVEFPVNMQFVAGAQANAGKGDAYSQAEAMDLLRSTATVTSKPFIYLSAGVSDAEFRESLTLAGEAGVPYSGVLCGRATWKDGVPIYGAQGLGALTDWLNDRGVKNIQALNEVISKYAKPWWTAFGGLDNVQAA